MNQMYLAIRLWLKPPTLEKTYEMSVSESLIQAFNCLPKFYSFQIDGTPAIYYDCYYFMILMEKNWTNKMSASSSQKQTNKQTRFNLLVAFLYGLQHTAAKLICLLSAMTCTAKTGSRKTNSVVLPSLLDYLSLLTFQENFRTSSCPKSAFQ